MKKVLAALGFFALGFAVQAQINPSSSHPQKDTGKAMSGERLQKTQTTLATLSTMAVTSCTPRGAATLGTPISGFLGSGSCTSFDPTYGTFYVDFYTFNATAGHTLQVLGDSTLSYLATIQSSTTGSVLASSTTCGFIQNSCSFTYTIPVSGSYWLGLGAYGTGAYALTVSDITAGGGGPGVPNLTPYRPNYTGYLWSDKIVVTKTVPLDTLAVDATSITTNDDLFASWAAINEGTYTILASVGTTMRNSLYLDGVLVQTWSGAPGSGDWQGGYWISAQGEPLGKLTAGSHTLEFRLDETNVVSESNENDNRYTKTFTVSNGSAGSCTPSVGNLCLNAGRFNVTVRYSASSGSGSGTAIPLTADTGYFWFFSSGNVEMVVKVVDGRAVNNHFWVFAGGLTNVDTTITVTDTATGAIKTYHNPANTAFQPIQDTSAF